MFWQIRIHDDRKYEEVIGKGGTYVLTRVCFGNKSLVTRVKSYLSKILNESVFSEVEYRTVFTEITWCINSRPLWPISEGDVEQPPVACLVLLPVQRISSATVTVTEIFL